MMSYKTTIEVWTMGKDRLLFTNAQIVLPNEVVKGCFSHFIPIHIISKTLTNLFYHAIIFIAHS